MKAAANSPALSFDICFVNLIHELVESTGHVAYRYVAQAVKPAKAGASMTQTFRISTGKLSQCRIFQMMPDVTMRPG